MNALSDPPSNNEKTNAAADASTQPPADASSGTGADNGGAHASGDERRGAGEPKRARPSLLLLASVALSTLALDLWSKDWALRTLEVQHSPGVSIPKSISLTPWLSMVLARNRGGAWGVFQTASDDVRKPFFLAVSALAIGLILYLYRRVHPKQHALKWGLPMVLGGAVGNLVDRVRHGWVVDFIDYKASWVRVLNEQLSRLIDNHHISDHWPTFNVADIAICVGVGLMAMDMFTSRSIHRQRAMEVKAAPLPQAPENSEVPGNLKSSEPLASEEGCRCAADNAISNECCCEEGGNRLESTNEGVVDDTAKTDLEAHADETAPNEQEAEQETKGAQLQQRSEDQALRLSSEQLQGAR